MKKFTAFVLTLMFSLCVGAVWGGGVRVFAEYEYNFITAAENDEAILLYDEAACAFRLVIKETGAYLDTKVMDGVQGNSSIRNLQKTDFVVSYLTNKLRGTSVTMDNYTQSIQLNQVSYEKIENGIRCSFWVGDPTKIQITMFPRYMSIERMEEMVLQYLTPQEIEQFKEYYTLTVDKYIRRDSNTATVAPLRLNRYNWYFYENGNYTFEDLEYDNEMFDEETVDNNITINVFVEYILDGRDLIVRVPMGDIQVNARESSLADILVYQLDLNPYIMVGSEDDDGYLFVPDGSGAVIDFNNGKSNAAIYNIPVYGTDMLNVPYFYKETFIQSTVPVYGMKRNDIAVMAIIEKGAEIATLSSQVSGKADEFNRTSISFSTLYIERMPIGGSVIRYITKYQQGKMEDDIQIRYKIFEGDDASYVGMAKGYRDYLDNLGDIKKNDVPENARLVVELLGAMDIAKNLFGIDFTSFERLTTFEQAKDIINTLRLNGVTNSVLQYTAWAEWSIYHKPLVGSVPVIGSLGGKSGLQSLISHANDAGIEVYPTINLVTTKDTKGLSRNKALSRFINSSYAFSPQFSFVDRMAGGQAWLISPNYLPKYVDQVIKSTDKINLDNLAISDAGWMQYGDYNKKAQLMRYEATPIIHDSLNKLADSKGLMYSNANAYAFASASYVTDLPFEFSNRRLVDYGIPFVQMVLENYIPYSLPAYNLNPTQGMDYYMLRAIESKSDIKFVLTESEEEIFAEHYDFQKYYQTKFSRWEDQIGGYYQEYDKFYQMVKNAEIKTHERVSANVVKMTYTNGVTVYLNYGQRAETVEGRVLEPISYQIFN